MGKFVCCLLLLVITNGIVGVIIRVVSLYGKNTAENDIYKQIMNDAKSFINDASGHRRSILPPDDQMSIIHVNVLDEERYENQNLFSVYQITKKIESMQAMAMITPSDFCDNCERVGSIIGEAYSPVITLDQADNSGAFKMRPGLDDMIEMMTEVIDHFKWKTFVILYEGRIAIKLVESFMSKATTYDWHVTPIEIEDDFEAQTEVLKKRKVRNVLVYVSNEDILKELILVAFDKSLLVNGWHWMFGNLNPPITKAFLEQKYRHNMAFLTRFKIVSNDLQYYTTIEEVIKRWPFRQRAAYDSLIAVAHAMRLHKEDTGQYPLPMALNDIRTSTLGRYLRQVSFHGASGHVSFNENGDRVNYTIIMYSGKDQSASETKAGIFVHDIRSWELSNNENWLGGRKRMYIAPFRQADPRHIKVLAVPEPPFFMQKNWESIRYGTDNKHNEEDEEYSGMAWELIKALKIVLEEEMGVDFEFNVQLKGRGQYGSLDMSNNEWDGMVRDLMDGDADIAIGALVNNEPRERVVDFTQEWYRSNIKLLVLHPSWTFEYPFSLVYPIDIWAWFMLLAFFVGTCLVVFFLGRYSPYDWYKRSLRGEASEEDGETFNLRNSIFYVLSTAFWQGYTKGPSAWSLRIFSLFWFWFMLFMVFLYSFSLNAVMKFSKTTINVQDVHDILYQDQFQFGLIKFSPAYDFYRYNEGQYRMVFDRVLDSDDILMEERIEHAVHLIRRKWEGQYTLLGEEQVLKYAAQRRPCRLYISGKSLGNITMAMATQSGSPLRDQITHAIKILEKNGELKRIREMEFSDSLHCERETTWERQSKFSITLHDLQGVYYILFIGMSGSVIVFILEWIVYHLFFNTGWKDKIPRRNISPNKKGFMGIGDTPLETDGPTSASADWI